MKKYELTDETVRVGLRTLYRVRALCDIPGWGVRAGDLGGFVEAERNLSQFGEAWVSDAAWVSGEAWVSGDARVSGNAWVSGNAQVFGAARVSGDARVYGADLLHVTGLPSGNVTFYPTKDGWQLNVGCWTGTVDGLEELIGSDEWPEATGEERELRRPGLVALVGLCRAHVESVAARSVGDGEKETRND